MSRRDPQPGDSVRVHLFNGRVIEATICVGGVSHTVSGTKIRVRSGSAVFLVGAARVKVMRGSEAGNA
jgi:hypothetical protein